MGYLAKYFLGEITKYTFKFDMFSIKYIKFHF